MATEITVGTSGADYVEFADAIQAIIDAAPLSDDYTIRFITDSTVSSSTAAKAILGNGRIIKVTQDAGVELTVTALNGLYLNMSGDSTDSEIFVDGLNIVSGKGMRILFKESTNQTGKVYNTRIDNISGVGLGFHISGTTLSLSGIAIDVRNCVISNYTTAGIEFTQNGNEPLGAVTKTFKNVVLYTDAVSSFGGTFYGPYRAVTEFINCGSFNNPTKDWTTGSGRTFLYCADSDGTVSGTGAINNIVASDEFISITSGDDGFLVPKSSSVLSNSGTDPVDFTSDINGVLFGGTYPIGPYVGLFVRGNIYSYGVGMSVVELPILPQFKPETKLALSWVQASDGNYKAIDRGASQDVYETTITYHGKRPDIDNFIDQIEANRQADSHVISLVCNEGQEIFGADVDYSSAIDCTVLEMSVLEQSSFKGFTLELKLRLISPTFTGSAVLPSLEKLSIGYKSGSVMTVDKLDSYDGTYSYLDEGRDVGIFIGEFNFSDAEMVQIRRYIATQRGNTISIPGVNGVSELFGTVRGGSYPYSVKVLDWEDMGHWGPRRWKMRLTLAEVV